MADGVVMQATMRFRSIAAVVTVTFMAVGCGAGSGSPETAQTIVSLAPPSSTSTTSSTTTTTSAPPSTTTAAPSTTTSTTTTTTTTSPDVATNRLAVDAAIDAMLEAPHLSYRATTTSSTEMTGKTVVFLEGTWSTESPTSALWIGFAFDDRATALLDMGLENDDLSADELRGLMSDGIEYHFIDDVAWVHAGGEWGGIPTSQLLEFQPLEAQTDASVTVLDVFDPYSGDWLDGQTEADGTTSYFATMDADRVLPLVATSSTLTNLNEFGWDATTGQTVDVRIFVSPDGRLARFELDQTSWWVDGWEFVGVGDLIGDDPSVTYRFEVTYPAEAVIHQVPCANPTLRADESGFDVLEC